MPESSSTHTSPDGAYAAIIGFAGCGALLWLAGPDSWWCGALLSAAGLAPLCVARADRGRRTAASPVPVVQRASKGARVRTVTSRCLELWERQIHTSRSVADDAVLRLATLFRHTVRQLDNALAAARDTLGQLAAEGGSVSAIRRSETDLRPVVSAMRTVRDRVHEELLGHSSDLKEMAEDVRKVSMQVQLLAFNANIEAHRAGDAGRSFAVVASEMRALATLAAETSARMVRKVEDIHRGVAGVGGTGSIDALVVAERALEALDSHFEHLSRSLGECVEVLQREGAAVRESIEEALATMQFQDRVSQIQAHVVSGSARLRGLLAREGVLRTDLEAWLEELARDFSTSEEFANLRPGHRTPAATSAVTFF